VATITQSSPRAAKAALWMAGDSECATGQPITDVTVVDPAGEPAT
jgi:hypothetical protein